MNFEECKAAFLKRCEELREGEIPRVEVQSLAADVENDQKLYNILKRSTDGRLNKIVAIGFTLNEAEEWMGRKVFQAKEKNNRAVFYDVVEMGNKAQLNPLWNPRPFVIGEAS